MGFLNQQAVCMPEKNDLFVVTVQANYVAQQSNPDNQKFVWSYHITITNQSEEIIQLLHRFWRITDMAGRVEEIQGAGVVGLQPLIKPGKPFSYLSFCQLTTPQGAMEGHYEMQDLHEKRFKVAIPKFVLTAPSHITQYYRSKLH